MERARTAPGQTTLFTDWLSDGFDVDHLAAVIAAAGGADPMGLEGSAALGAGAQAGKREHAVVGSAHTLPALRRFALRDAHKFRILTCSTRTRLPTVCPSSCRSFRIDWLDQVAYGPIHRNSVHTADAAET
jgi:hypothetical protein